MHGIPGLAPVALDAGPWTLRPWRPEDVDEVFAACQDPEIQRWTRVPVPYRREHARQYVEEMAPSVWQDGTGAPFAVTEPAGGRLMASVALVAIDRNDQTADIGFWTAPWARGRGVMTEAVVALCHWGFAVLGLGRVEWTAFVGNDASRRVAEKAGFVVEGVARGRHLHRGRRMDAWVGGLLPADLDAAARPRIVR
jgi:RimJ/RimL family protein N-acetyltransferase